MTYGVDAADIAHMDAAQVDVVAGGEVGDRVGAEAARIIGEDVVAGAAGHGVVARSADNGVVSAAPSSVSVPAVAIDVVVGGTARQVCCRRSCLR